MEILFFQQDLAPSHWPKPTTKYFTARGFTALYWPANSPDLIPTDNMRSIVKRKMRNIQIEMSWRHLSKQHKLQLKNPQLDITCKLRYHSKVHNNLIFDLSWETFKSFIITRQAGLSISEKSSKKMVQERENVQWVGVLWLKMPCWCQMSLWPVSRW